MTGYRFFKAIQLVFMLGVIVLAGIVVCLNAAYSEISREIKYHDRLGPGWQLEYEKNFGSLSDTRMKAVVAILGAVAIASLAAWLYRVVTQPAYATGSVGRRKKSRGHRFHSSLERTTHYWHKARWRIWFGIAYILSGACFAIFRWGIFSDHSNEILLGFVMFLCGYCAVISGCSWWLKAKAWNGAVVFIGMMPLALLFVPYVRLIFVAAPMLLPVMMIMMPLILVVVVLVLPDKSGTSNRRR